MDSCRRTRFFLDKRDEATARVTRWEVRRSARFGTTGAHQKPASERGQGRQREKQRARRREAKGANRRAEARHAKERRRQRTLVPNPPSTSSIPGFPASSTCNMSQSSSDEFEDDIVDPTEIFSLEDYLAQQNTLNNFAAQIATNIHDALAAPSTRRRSAPRTYIDRKREFYNQLLIEDYFSDNPTYPDYYFRRWFRMGKPLFLRIFQALGEWSSYFTQRVDAFGRPSLSPLQKYTTAMHMLAYGVPADKTDDHIRLGASTTLKCLENFAKGVIAKFGGEYLRRPTVEDIQRLLEIGEARGFPGMLGSINCMHWEWKNCPSAWKGHFTHGDYGVPTIILEAVASHDLWIWHAFFGVPGSNNDINVLNRSPLFTETLQGNAPRIDYYVNEQQYKKGYYLADGIYPEWAVFVKTIRLPQT